MHAPSDGTESLDWLHTNFPCRAACPVGTNAGGYVSLIAEGRYEDAYRLARRPNPLASICGWICAHPCEAACRRGVLDRPISIRALKRFVCERHGVESARDFEKILEDVERPRPAAEKGGKVAIIGAGPAGLACAHDLALMGHEAVIFESAPVTGGMLKLGIPPYRLPRELIDCEVDFIKHLGVEIRLRMEIGRDVEFKDLRRDYDAVFVGAGCRKGKGLAIPGAELPGVLTAVDLLVAVNLGAVLNVGERVVVVGGGSVAADAARSVKLHGGTSEPDEEHHRLLMDSAMLTARSLKREVTMVCLESRDEMPADEEEVDAAEAEGITILNRRGPVRVLEDENGVACGIETLDVTRVFDDTVILAVGQVADLSFLGDDHGLEITPQNTLSVERETLATSARDVFAGGDVAFGPRIAIEAVADGRRAARAIDLRAGRLRGDPSRPGAPRAAGAAHAARARRASLRGGAGPHGGEPVPAVLDQHRDRLPRAHRLGVHPVRRLRGRLSHGLLRPRDARADGDGERR